MMRTCGRHVSSVAQQVSGAIVKSRPGTFALLHIGSCTGRHSSSAVDMATRAASSGLIFHSRESESLNQPWRQQRRGLSSYKFLSGPSGGAGNDVWPITQTNTLVNVCQQVRSRDFSLASR